MAAKPLHLSWHNPVQVEFGSGCRHQLPTNQPVVVLADRGAVSVADEAQLMERLGTQCVVWHWIPGNLATVKLAQAICKALWPVMDVYPQATVVAIGGGTALDLAKVLRYRLAQADPTQWANCWRTNTVPTFAVRHALWLLPTTAGTGSEVTRWATLWDADVQTPVKLSWAPGDGYAERAWVDPELCASCPERVTRDCGLDALSHALEAIWNHRATAWTNAIAVHAARTVLQSLPRALKDLHDVQSRDQLSHASLLAGLAMSQTQTALAHALSYDLTLQEGLAHGEACAVWLPMAWELSLGASPDSDLALSRVFDCSAEEGAQRLRNWLEAMNVQHRELRGGHSGESTLSREMRSNRGRNFIAAEQ